MSRLKLRSVDTDIEKRILIGMIVSTKFLKDVIPAIDLNFFQIDYSRKVVSWVLEYYGKYKEAPNRHIEDIFKTKEWDRSLRENEVELVEDFLSSLSSRYEEENFNSDYLLDKAFEYFKERALFVTSEDIKALLGVGKVDEAEKQLIKYKKVARITSGWMNPFSQEYVSDIFADKDDYLFSFPGVVGDKFGGFKRGWFVGVMAPYKRGKTWMLQELAIQAFFKRLRVAFFSLEMAHEFMADRIYKRITGAADNRTGGRYPVFDCIKNQLNDCNSKLRENHIKLLDDEGNKPRFNVEMEYRPCTACRGVKGRKDNYYPDYWFVSTDYESMTFKMTSKAINGLRMMYGDNFRIMSYPRFSANLSKIKADLDILEQTENFIPDVILVDYADILSPEDDRVEDRRDRIDETWKTMGGMSGERHCIVITASQTTRKSITKKNVEMSDTAEDIRKQGHVDVMFAQSQTQEEKRYGIMRLGLVAHRHRLFDELDQVTILQSLETGQPMLDGEVM